MPWTQYIPLLAEQISFPHWHDVVSVFSTVPSLLEHATAAEHVSTVLWQNKLEEHVWVPQIQSSVFLIAPVVSWHATIDGGALQTHLFSDEQATEEAAVLNVYSEVPDQNIELSM